MKARYRLAIPLPLLAVGLPSQALAQRAPNATLVAGPTSDTDDDIVVTARRREERLRDVPIAATVIDAQSIADRGGVRNVQDIVQNSPGVRFFNTTSQLNSEISVRGSGTARGTNADPSVGLYRNGMFVGGGYLGGRNFTRIDLFDIGRVEVLRGTQGALYGRDAVGGAVNFVSAEPVFKREGFLDANYGFEQRSFQLQGVVNEPLTDTLALRVGVSANAQSKGFFYNPDNDVYFDQTKGYGARAQLRFKSGPVDINALGETQRLRIPAVAFRVYVRPGANANFPLGYVQPPYDYPWNFPPKATQDVDMQLLSASIDLKFATLSSTTGHRIRQSYFQFDQDGLDAAALAALNAQGQNRNANPNLSMSNGDKTRIWSQDLHLTGAKVGGFSWLLGGEWFDEKTNYEIFSGTTLTRPIAGTRTSGVQTYKSLAAYGSIGYDVTSAFNVTGELRYTHDDKAIRSAQFNRVTGAPGSSQFALNARTKPSNLAYSAVASLKPVPGWLAYAKVGTGYRSGGFNYNLGDARQPVPIPASYGNEVSTTYEVGTKGSLARWLYVTAAGYLTTVDNVIVGTQNGCSAGSPICPTASVPFLVNAGTARTWGIEFDATARFTLAGGSGRLTLSGSHQRGEVTSGIYDGAEMPQTPHWIASATVNYRVPVGTKTSLFFNANYQGSFGGINELTAPNTPFYQATAAGPFQSPIGDISLLDLRAGVGFGPLEVSLYAKNAFNYRYVVYEAISTQRLNTPRAVGVEARLRW